MSKKLIVRTAKLLTESKRGSRSKGVAITYEHIPQDVEERNHGSIYAVININAPNGDAQEITELILDAFHGEYYQDLSRDPLSSFETALAKVNEELGEATQQGNTSWLKNLNAILAVLSGTTLHITKAGKTEAYLYRGEKSSFISDDLGGDTVNPLRTFINVASGELQENDKVVIATPGVFFHISKDELQKYVLEFQPKVAISHLADLVEGTSSEVSPNAILILEAITPEVASNETLEEQPDEVWISEPNKPVQNAIDTSAPFIKKVFSILTFSWLGVIALVQDFVIPPILFGYHQTGKLITNFRSQNGAKKKPKEKVLVETEESIVPKEDLDDLAIKESDESIFEKPKKATSQEIFIKESDHKPKWLKLEKVDFSVAKNFGHKLKKTSSKLTTKRKNLLIIAIIVLVLVGAGVFLTWRGKDNNKNLKQAQASLTEVQSKYDIGKSALASGEKQKAAEALRSAETIANSLVNNKNVGGNAKNLLAKIETSLDQAEGVVRINPNSFSDAKNIVGSNPFGPYLIAQTLYLVNKDNASVAAISSASGEVSTAIDKPQVDGKIIAATAVSRRSVLVLFTEKSSVYEFDTKELKMAKQDMAGDVEKSTALTSYLTNIYSLDGVNGIVYKRLKTSTGYAKRTNYITDGSNVKGGAGLATDSSIYILENDGQVVKYLAGKKQNFTITDLPFTLSNPNTIFANEGVNGLYITDPAKKRVVILDANGKFVSQQISDKFNNLSGVYVVGSTLYVSADGQLYKLTI
ncbi:MAG: hypothetical protein PHU86_00005 [Patescibacteria group bacterium]|nr:hypothetical protein [Patescibacteria group bacterium]